MMAVEEHLKQIRGEVDDIEKRINGWAVLYQGIRMESIAHDFPCAAARSAANKMLNRYRDVSPFDHSRVVLSKGSSDYINASLVQVSRAGRRYILTQGPLPHTAGHFWEMVWEQNSKAILMLNKVIEKNQVKCFQYWPLGTSDDDKVMEFHDVDLRVRHISEKKSRNFVVRTLKIEDMTSSESREVFQFHYTTWPDFGVPSTTRTFLHFLQVVRDSGVLNANVGPAVVHCSAGIGRSGTFCLVDSCLLMMEEGLSVNIKDVLMDMRKFRMGLIQTADQLKFSYLTILEGLQQLAEGKKRFICDENENGDVEVIDVDEKPAPPRRSASLAYDQVLILRQRGVEGRPQRELPPVPAPSSEEDPSAVHEELYRRLIQARDMEVEERPQRELPPIPTSSSEEESSEDSMIDDDDIDDSSANKSESSEEKPIPIPRSMMMTSTTSESQAVVNANESSSIKADEPPVAASPIDSTEVITNGTSSTPDEAAVRRRAKQEALREKIKEIKAHQKEAEAVQGFYRSPKPKRRKESREEDDDDEGGGDNDDDDNGGGEAEAGVSSRAAASIQPDSQEAAVDDDGSRRHQNAETIADVDDDDDDNDDKQMDSTPDKLA